MKNTLIILLLTFSFAAFAGNNKADRKKEAKAKEWIKNQPLEFIENKGQFMRTDGKTADEVLFKTSFGGCDIYITNKGLSYVFVKMEEVEQNEILKTENKREEEILHKLKFGEKDKYENKSISYYRLDMNLEGASISKSNIIKENESNQGHYNYFYAHCPEGIYDVKGYGKITIKNIYKGIDWVIYTNSNSMEHPLKYDFVVHPEADYKDIKIKFMNAQSTSLTDNDSKLKIQTIAGIIEEGNLYSYQSNSNNEINSKYIIDKDSIISFKIANYDTIKTLVIDPLVWATYYGGNGNYDRLASICSDSQDNIYITGHTHSTNFPIQQLGGAYYQSSISGGNPYYEDIIILKFNNYGQRQWATYYGGGGFDNGHSIISDNQDNIYISGITDSPDFPTQQLIGAYYRPADTWNSDAFIIKFNTQGQRQWATCYYGINKNCFIIADSQNNIYITGGYGSTSIETQQMTGAYWQANTAGYNEIVIIKFNNQGQRLWATYYGGSGNETPFSIYRDNQDNIYITGHTDSQNFPIQQLVGAYWQPTNAGGDDIFLLKFNNLGQRLWATYYGGINNDFSGSICTDSIGSVYVTGNTNSPNFPTQQLTGAFWQAACYGHYDAFIIKFNSQGQRLWATYYGGNYDDGSSSICVDIQDNIYITGYTRSTNFPIQQLIGTYNQILYSGNGDVFIVKFDKNGIRKWATYYGESQDYGHDITVDNQNSIYFIGKLSANGAYTIDYGNGAYYDSSSNGSSNGFILKFTHCNLHKPVYLLTNRNNICTNDNGNIILTATGGIGDTLKWYTGVCGQNYIGENTPLSIPSPTQTTTYFARWEKACGYSDCDSIIINIYSEIDTIQNIEICQGDSIKIGIHTYFTTGIFKDTISSISGCDSIVTTNLTVNPKKYTTLNQSICQGEVFNIGIHNYSIAGTYIDTLSTYLGCDSIITTYLTVNPIKHTSLNPIICQGELYQVGNHYYTLNGTYIDTLTTNFGCDSIITSNLIVKPLPNVNLGSNEIICEGDTVELNVNNGYTSYLWQDGSMNNKFAVSKPGIYWVEVNYNNCFKSDTVIFILCEEEVRIWIPNSFTPNGDGLNDVFKIETIGEFSNFNMSIYNRWGERIFESSNPLKGWNGMYKGNNVQFGVYTYKIDIKGKVYKQIKTYSGKVTLIR